MRPPTAILVGVNVLVYMVTVYQGGGVGRPGGKLFLDGALIGAAIDVQGEWYRLVTAMFLHGSLLHLLFNMLALYWLGTIVEQALGTWRFLLIYFVSGIAGSAGALALSGPFEVTVGASGAIYGIMGALLVLEYRATGTFAGQALALIVVNLALTFAHPEHLDRRPSWRAGRRRPRHLRPRALPARPAHGRSARRSWMLIVVASSLPFAYVRVESYV